MTSWPDGARVTERLGDAGALVSAGKITGLELASLLGAVLTLTAS